MPFLLKYFYSENSGIPYVILYRMIQIYELEGLLNNSQHRHEIIINNMTLFPILFCIKNYKLTTINNTKNLKDYFIERCGDNSLRIQKNKKNYMVSVIYEPGKYKLKIYEEKYNDNITILCSDIIWGEYNDEKKLIIQYLSDCNSPDTPESFDDKQKCKYFVECQFMMITNIKTLIPNELNDNRKIIYNLYLKYNEDNKLSNYLL